MCKNQIKYLLLTLIFITVVNVSFYIGKGEAFFRLKFMYGSQCVFENGEYYWKRPDNDKMKISLKGIPEMQVDCSELYSIKLQKIYKSTEVPKDEYVLPGIQIAEFILTNNSDDTIPSYSYTPEYRLEQKIGEEWFRVIDGISFTGMTNDIDPKESIRLSLRLQYVTSVSEKPGQHIFHPVPSGHYRVLKKIGEYYYSTEFDVVR